MCHTPDGYRRLRHIHLSDLSTALSDLRAVKKYATFWNPTVSCSTKSSAKDAGEKMQGALPHLLSVLTWQSVIILELSDKIYSGRNIWG